MPRITRNESDILKSLNGYNSRQEFIALQECSRNCSSNDLEFNSSAIYNGNSLYYCYDIITFITLYTTVCSEQRKAGNRP